VSYEADIETVREFIAAKGSMRGYAPMVALDRLAAEHKRLRDGLRHYADARNWGIEREDRRYPRAVWIGDGARETPVPNPSKVARALLDDEGTA